MTDTKHFLKQAAIQIGAGGTAGFVEVCIMHPLDLVKTRLQIQSNVKSSDHYHYTGIVDCLRKMYKHEGITSFWKGILPPILAETPKRALKFFTFEQYKKFFLFGASTATPLTFSLAGLSAGITEAIFINPFEVVKVTMQSNKSIASKAPSMWTETRRIVREQGFGSKGLNKGLTATILRHGIFNMIYFGFYHTVKGFVPVYKEHYVELAKSALIGFTAGSLASLVNIPFDVAKSRIQGPQPTPGVIKYSSTIQSIMLVKKEEGFRALYKGLLPKVLRLGPGGAIMLIVYEYTYDYLQKKFKDY